MMSIGIAIEIYDRNPFGEGQGSDGTVHFVQCCGLYGHTCARRPGGRSERAAIQENRASLKYQSPGVERAKALRLVCLGRRRLDSMKTPTLFAGMGSANRCPWADPQPANQHQLKAFLSRPFYREASAAPAASSLSAIRMTGSCHGRF